MAVAVAILLVVLVVAKSRRDPAFEETQEDRPNGKTPTKSEGRQESAAELLWRVDAAFDKKVYKLSQDKEIRVTVTTIRWPKSGMRLTTHMVSGAYLNWSIHSEPGSEHGDLSVRWVLPFSQPPTLEEPGDPLELPYTIVFPLAKALQGSKGEVACGDYYVSLVLPSFIETVGSEQTSIYVKP